MSWFFDNLFKRSKAKTDTSHSLIDKKNNQSSKADTKFTSYDTSKAETSTPQKVREGNEPEAQHQRLKKSYGDREESSNKESHTKKKK